MLNKPSVCAMHRLHMFDDIPNSSKIWHTIFPGRWCGTDKIGFSWCNVRSFDDLKPFSGASHLNLFPCPSYSPSAFHSSIAKPPLMGLHALITTAESMNFFPYLKCCLLWNQQEQAWRGHSPSTDMISGSRVEVLSDWGSKLLECHNLKSDMV